jgi:hypothetical protein
MSRVPASVARIKSAGVVGPNAPGRRPSTRVVCFFDYRILRGSALRGEGTSCLPSPIERNG